MKQCRLGPDRVCLVCGRKAWSENTLRNCHPGLGDLVATGLAAVGITKERVESVVGGPCGCPERRDALNRLGHSLGIGAPDRVT